MEQFSLVFEKRRQTFTVTELTTAVQNSLGEFGTFWVSGEVSGSKLSSSGHWYFNLKDAGAQVPSVAYRASLVRLKVKPRDGLAVIARGRLDVYAPKGAYQFIVEAMEPEGVGALQLAFEQLKKRLEQEGLFDSARKRALPRFPRRIGIVTSPTGSVIRDMLTVLERRHPGLHIRLFPAAVQGEAAVGEIVRGLRYFSESGWAEVVIVGRGGGSLEDLWAFNDEAVARAIVASSVPVVSAVGHETDFTIADFVADQRAATPSAAAEIVVYPRAEILQSIDTVTKAGLRMVRYLVVDRKRRVQDWGVDRPAYSLQRRLRHTSQRVDESAERMRDLAFGLVEEGKRRRQELESRLRQTDVRVNLAMSRQRLVLLEMRLKGLERTVVSARSMGVGEALQGGKEAIARRLLSARRRFEVLAPQLEQLSPVAILERGYAIVRTAEGAVVKSPGQVAKDDRLRVLVAGGEFEVKG